MYRISRSTRYYAVRMIKHLALKANCENISSPLGNSTDDLWTCAQVVKNALEFGLEVSKLISKFIVTILGLV